MNWETITNIIQNIFTIVSSITSALLQNELFQIIIGIVIFSYMLFIIFRLIYRLKNGYIYDDREYSSKEMKNLRELYNKSAWDDELYKKSNEYKFLMSGKNKWIDKDGVEWNLNDFSDVYINTFNEKFRR